MVCEYSRALGKMLTQAISSRPKLIKFATFLPIYEPMCKITVGVLALQGAFYEHLQLLQKAVVSLKEAEGSSTSQWEFIEVRNVPELNRCDALVLPGGESTTISLVAASSNLLEPLRDFVKYVTCFLSWSYIVSQATYLFILFF